MPNTEVVLVHGWWRRRGVIRLPHSLSGKRKSGPPDMGIRYLLSVAIIAAYAAFMVHKYGVKEGLIATYLTWSFFVLGTPVADAGGILDVPLRLLTGFPMFAIEFCVVTFTLITMWIVVNFRPEAFDRTPLLRAFREMLTNPVPYWGLIALCILGTFMSVRLGDIAFDVFAAGTGTGMPWSFPVEFWIGCAIYSLVLWAYVTGMLPLLRPLLQTDNAYKALF